MRISRGQERAKPHLTIADLKSVNFAELAERRQNYSNAVTAPRTSSNQAFLEIYLKIMQFPATASLLALSSFLCVAIGHNIQLKAHDRECFHESLHRDDKMTVTFQVGDREFGGAGNLDIDFWVRICAEYRRAGY